MRYLLDLRDPVPDGIEGLLVCDIVNQKNALCASEIRGSDGAEALLTSRVPDLQLDSLGIAGFVSEKERESAAVVARDRGGTIRHDDRGHRRYSSTIQGRKSCRHGK